MRQIPVSFDLAPAVVIAKMVELQAPGRSLLRYGRKLTPILPLKLNGTSSERVSQNLPGPASSDHGDPTHPNQSLRRRLRL